MERILVIDDDVELCELVTEYLEPDGYAIEAASDPVTGLERAMSGGDAKAMAALAPAVNDLSLVEIAATGDDEKSGKLADALARRAADVLLAGVNDAVAIVERAFANAGRREQVVGEAAALFAQHGKGAQHPADDP